jgi:hypothetical protein
MTGRPNPAISGDAILKALRPDDPKVMTEQQRALDEADLREFERAEYYRETPVILEATATAAKPRRSILDRLLRR